MFAGRVLPHSIWHGPLLAGSTPSGNKASRPGTLPLVSSSCVKLAEYAPMCRAAIGCLKKARCLLRTDLSTRPCWACLGQTRLLNARAVSGKPARVRRLPSCGQNAAYHVACFTGSDAGVSCLSFPRSRIALTDQIGRPNVTRDERKLPVGHRGKRHEHGT